MTNQASEDVVDSILSTLGVVDRKSGNRPGQIEVVKQIIRTEKLKLLAEVRERVVGNIVCTCGCNFGDGCLCLDKTELRTEQYELLTKLETEL